jgi:hypothetical protein
MYIIYLFTNHILFWSSLWPIGEGRPRGKGTPQTAFSGLNPWFRYLKQAGLPGSPAPAIKACPKPIMWLKMADFE